MTTEALSVKVAEAEARAKSNSHRLDEVEKRQADNDRVVASIARIAQRQDSMDGDLKEIKSDVKLLTGKSGRRWDAVVDKIIALITAAAVSAILTGICLNG